MYWKISIISLLLLVACQQEKQSTSQAVEEPSQAFNYVIEVSELRPIISQENIKLIDFRKKEAYDQGHIHGALNIWRSDIEDDSYPYDGMMASPSQIEALFSSLGITNDDLLVLYDDNGLCDASRLWWVLQNYDFTNVKMLNGGLQEWISNGGEITNELPTPSHGNFQLTDTPSMKYYISKEEMRKAVSDSVIILDTRSKAEYAGIDQKKGAAKAGRIPGSIHMDWVYTMDATANKKFKSKEELATLYEEVIAMTDRPIVTYCHSGVRSAHTTFVLTQLLGLENVKNYDGSWVEWSHFDDLPIEKDSIKTIIN